MQILSFSRCAADSASLLVCNFILKGKAEHFTLPLRKRAICYNERWGKTHPTKQRHIPEDRWAQNNKPTLIFINPCIVV